MPGSVSHRSRAGAIIPARWFHLAGQTSRAAPSPPTHARAAVSRSFAVPRVPRREPTARGLAALHAGDLRDLVRTWARGDSGAATRWARDVGAGVGRGQLMAWRPPPG